VTTRRSPILAGLSPGYGGRDGGRRSRRETTIELQLTDRSAGDWTVLDIVGEVDLYTAPALRDRIASLIDGGVRRLVVNLAEVGFLDSSGLGVLIGALRRLKEHDGVLRLVCNEGSTLKVLTVTGLDKVFQIHTDLGSATAS
jgi:anti-sigma B factor antagonist